MQEVWSDGSVTIRPYIADDVPDLFEAAIESLADVSPWLPWLADGYTRDESRDWVADSPSGWERGERYSFAVLDTETGDFLGGVGLNQINTFHRFANLGYWVRTAATGRGIAPAATRLCAEFGFRELNLIRVEILTEVANERSKRVAENVGATREGVLRDRLWMRDVARDAVMYSLVPSDLGIA